METIVAATILFTALAAAAFSYNSAVNLTRKLNITIAAGAALPEIQREIKFRLFEGESEGEQRSANGVHYFWHAETQKKSPTILGENSMGTDGLMYGRFQVALVAVTLTIIGDKTGDEESRYRQLPVEYRELVWQPR